MDQNPTFITIDARESKDLDDALGIETRPDGSCTIHVAIADVASFVPQGSDCEAAARRHLVTEYREWGSVPMLGWRVEHEASLLPGMSRPAMFIQIDLDTQMRVTDTRVLFGKVKSKAKLAHPDVPVIVADPTHPLHGQVAALHLVAQRLYERRRTAGALALWDLNDGWTVSEEGFLVKLDREKANAGYVLVQEMMVLANAALATLCAERNIAVLWRNHRAKPHAPDRAALLRELDGVATAPVEVVANLRARTHLVLERADYSATLGGHFGLGLPAYLHATSPIRRYADLVVQRQLKAWACDQSLPMDQTALATEATWINDTLTKWLNIRKEAEKARVDRVGADRLDMSPESLLNLSTADFERVIKVATRSGALTPELDKAVRVKIAERSLPLLDRLYLLMEVKTGLHPEWTPLRQAVLDDLVKNPHDALSLHGIGVSILGWGSPVWLYTEKGPDHIKMFDVHLGVTADKGFVMARGRINGAPSKKIGQQWAMCQVIATLAHLPIPEFKGREEIAAPSPGKVKDEAPSNPVAALNEQAQRNRKPMPEYTWVRDGGPDHAPSFICTVTLWNGSTATSDSSADKKAAKRQAAERAVALGV